MPPRKPTKAERSIGSYWLYWYPNGNRWTSWTFHTFRWDDRDKQILEWVDKDWGPLKPMLVQGEFFEESSLY